MVHRSRYAGHLHLDYDSRMPDTADRNCDTHLRVPRDIAVDNMEFSLRECKGKGSLGLTADFVAYKRCPEFSDLIQ